MSTLERCLESFATANVGAGSDTVSAGLQSFVYHLLRHPGGWRRAQNEIREAQAQGRCKGEVISFADAARLPYLQACIKEGMRVHAPISGMWNNQLTQSTMLACFVFLPLNSPSRPSPYRA